MRKYFLTSISIALLLLFTSCNDFFGVQDESAPLAAISDGDVYAFGNGPLNGSIDKTFTFTNTGTVAIKNLRGSTLASPFAFKGGSFPGTGGTCADTIAIGGSCTFVVTFSPNALGSYSDTITLSFRNSAETKEERATRPVTANAVEGATLSISDGATYNYGRVSIASPQEKTFTVTNTGGFEAGGLSPSISSPFSLPGGGTCSSTLAAGSSCTLIVRFSPTTFTTSTDTLTLAYTNGGTALSTTRAVTGLGVGASGAIDTTFGSLGRVATSLGMSLDQVTGSALQSDGKLVVGGNYQLSPSTTTDAGGFLARMNADGSLDTSFFTSGLRSINSLSVAAVMIDTSGRLLVGGGSSISRYLPDGSTDSTFNGDGAFSFSPPADTDNSITALAVDSSGKIIAIGRNGGALLGGLIARYDSDGTLDNTFSTDGWHTPAENPSDYRTVVLTGNKIIAAGRHNPAGMFLVNRFEPDGSLDTSFFTTGTLTDTLGSMGIDHEVTSVLIDTSSRIVLGGLSWDAGVWDIFSLKRLLSSGAVDGIYQTDFNDELDAGGAPILRLESTGRLVAAMSGTSGGLFMSRLNDNLTLDTTSSNISGSTPILVRNLQFTTDGKFFLVGAGKPNPGWDWMIARGNVGNITALDTSFQTRGILFRNITNSVGSQIHTLLRQSDQKLIAVGKAYTGLNYSLAIARYETTGSLDTSFNTVGWAVASFGTGGTVPYSATLRTDGRIVAIGMTSNGLGLATFHANGTLDTAFRTTGIAIPLTGSNYFGLDVVEGTDGILTGVGSFGGGTDTVVLRMHSNGTLDTSFNSSGSKTSNLGGSDRGNAVTLQTNGLILVAGSVTNPAADFVLARFILSGALDTAFKTSGIVSTAVSAGTDAAYQMELETDGRIFVSGYGVNGGGVGEFAFARYLATGDLDTTFGSSGVTVNSFAASVIVANAGAILETSGNYVASGSTTTGATKPWIFARLTSNGTLDTSFATQGRLSTTMAGTGGIGYSLNRDAEGRYLLGGYAFQTTGSQSNFTIIRVWP